MLNISSRLRCFRVSMHLSRFSQWGRVLRFSGKFSTLESLLGRVHEVASDKRMAFQARLKNFLRLGLIDDVKAGRGKAAKFEAEHILMLALAIELSQIGVSPEKAVSIIRNNISKIAAAVLVSVSSTKNGFGNDWSPTVIYFDPKALSSLTLDDQSVAEVKFSNVEQFKLAFRDTISDQTRLAVISLTAMIVRLADGLDENPNFPTGVFFATALLTWARQYDLDPQT